MKVGDVGFEIVESATWCHSNGHFKNWMTTTHGARLLYLLKYVGDP